MKRTDPPWEILGMWPIAGNTGEDGVVHVVMRQSRRVWFVNGPVIHQWNHSQREKFRIACEL